MNKLDFYTFIYENNVYILAKDFAQLQFITGPNAFSPDSFMVFFNNNGRFEIYVVWVLQRVVCENHLPIWCDSSYPVSRFFAVVPSMEDVLEQSHHPKPISDIPNVKLVKHITGSTPFTYDVKLVYRLVSFYHRPYYSWLWKLLGY